MITLGIDVGGSTTKIIGVEDGEIRAPQCITAADPVTSLFGALGKYIYDNGISLGEIEQYPARFTVCLRPGWTSSWQTLPGQVSGAAWKRWW